MAKAINNARDVLDAVEKYLALIREEPTGSRKKRFNLYGKSPLGTDRRVCDEISVFDWWTSDFIGATNLKAIRSFIKEGLKLGYEGYVCFKIGASGCANGMWAHRAESYDGYSPKGACLYRSFTPDYVCWEFSNDDEVFFPPRDKWNMLKTVADLECFHDHIVGRSW